MADKNRDFWEEMYHMPLEELPWEIQEAPSELREYIEGNIGDGGKALDAGCGTGNFSIYLAQNGFKVVGVDLSEKAIEIARDRVANLNLPIRFIRSDLTELKAVLPRESFDLVLDYKVSHLMEEKYLVSYLSQLKDLLTPGGRILLVCFSDKDEDAAGQSAAIGKFGNELYYRTTDEIRHLYSAFREISYQEVMLGKRLQRFGHCFVFEKNRK